MTIHVSLVSKNIVNVFVGTKEEEEAQAVTYSAQMKYGFDIPVADHR